MFLSSFRLTSFSFMCIPIPITLFYISFLFQQALYFSFPSTILIPNILILVGSNYYTSNLYICSCWTLIPIFSFPLQPASFPSQVEQLQFYYQASRKFQSHFQTQEVSSTFYIYDKPPEVGSTKVEQKKCGQ